MQSFLTASVTALTWISRMSRPRSSGSALELELLDQLAHGSRRLLEGCVLLRREGDLDDLLDAPAAELHRHPDVEPLDPVLPGQVRRARQDLLLVLQDRLDHLHRRGSWRVVGAPRLQERHDLRAAVG